MRLNTAACGIAIAGGLLVLGGCGTTAEPGSTGMQAAFLGSVADPIGAFTIPPSDVRDLTYASTDTFDRSLHASMKGRTPVIKVTVPAAANLTLSQLNTPATALTQDDARMARWTRRIKESGGAVVACVDQPQESLIWTALALLLRWGSPILTQYVTYGPAEAYHAVVFYEAAAPEKVKLVKFVTRSQITDVANLTCRAAAAL